MKRVVILVVLLIIFSGVSFAKEVDVPETYTLEKGGVLGESATTYIYAGNKLIASKQGDELNYHYQDRLGSDVDSKSLPFGQEIVNSERFSFTGKELDSDLYYFGARYYDSNTGRFTSVDPVKDNHAYSYVSNNPIMLVDPSGLQLEIVGEEGANAWGRVGVGGESFKVISRGQGIRGLLTASGELQNIFLLDPDLIFESSGDVRAIDFFPYNPRIGGSFNYETGRATVYGVGGIGHELAHAGEIPGFRGNQFLSEWHAYLRGGRINFLSGRDVLSIERAAMGGDFMDYLRNYQIGYGGAPSAAKAVQMGELNVVKSFLRKFGGMASSEAFGIGGDVYDAWNGYNNPEAAAYRFEHASENSVRFGQSLIGKVDMKFIGPAIIGHAILEKMGSLWGYLGAANSPNRGEPQS